jgi:hypothetical protein
MSAEECREVTWNLGVPHNPAVTTVATVGLFQDVPNRDSVRDEPSLALVVSLTPHDPEQRLNDKPERVPRIRVVLTHLERFATRQGAKDNDP